MATRKTARRSERRTAPRAEARLSMRVEGMHEGGTAQLVTESQNISTSGVYCTSTHYLPPLSKVGLTIVLPRLPGGRAAEELIKCEGIVVRCEQTAGRRDRHWQLACAFSDLDPKRRALLDTFVHWRNLQALRAAATANGKAPAARPKARKKAAVRKSATASASRATARPAARKKTARRRPTVH